MTTMDSTRQELRSHAVATGPASIFVVHADRRSPRPVLLAAAVLVFGLGWATGRFVRPAASHASSTEQQYVATPAPKPPAELTVLLDFAREQDKKGRVLVAQIAYEKAMASSDKDCVTAAKKELDALKARLEAHTKSLDNAMYQPFADCLNASAGAVNNCHFHGMTYTINAEEAQALFGRYLQEREMTGALHVNLRYPLYCWGANHPNLQTGLAMGIVDALTAEVSRAGDVAGLARAFQAKARRQEHFHIIFDFLRELEPHGEIPVALKGQMYWRANEALLTLVPKDPAAISPSMQQFLSDLKQTVARFEKYKDDCVPASAHPGQKPYEF